MKNFLGKKEKCFQPDAGRKFVNNNSKNFFDEK